MVSGKRDTMNDGQSKSGSLFLLLLTAAGLWGEVVYNLAIMQGQLRWIAVMPLFLVALYGLPVGGAWIFTLRRKANAWSRGQVALFALVVVRPDAGSTRRVVSITGRSALASRWINRLWNRLPAAWSAATFPPCPLRLGLVRGR